MLILSCLSWMRRIGIRWRMGIRWLGLVALIAVAFGSGGYVARMSANQAAPDRNPNADTADLMDHKSMVQAGMACLYCHSDALRSPAAGVPSMESCMGCHDVIKTESPAIQALTAAWERGDPIQWERVNRLPRFVYFSHRAHVVAGGLNCERCHGDVGQMSVVRPVVDMNMGWCLTCHEQQPDAAALVDCIVCHQ
jgi:hypothetical protein